MKRAISISQSRTQAFAIVLAALMAAALFASCGTPTPAKTEPVVPELDKNGNFAGFEWGTSYEDFMANETMKELFPNPEIKGDVSRKETKLVSGTVDVYGYPAVITARFADFYGTEVSELYAVEYVFEQGEGQFAENISADVTAAVSGTLGEQKAKPVTGQLFWSDGKTLYSEATAEQREAMLEEFEKSDWQIPTGKTPTEFYESLLQQKYLWIAETAWSGKTATLTAAGDMLNYMEALNAQ